MGSIVVLTWIYQISWKGSTSFPHQSGFNTLTCFIISVLSNIINYQNFYYHSYANGTQTHHLKLNFCSFQPRINVKALSFQSTTRPVSKKAKNLDNELSFEPMLTRTFAETCSYYYNSLLAGLPAIKPFQLLQNATKWLFNFSKYSHATSHLCFASLASYFY